MENCFKGIVYALTACFIWGLIFVIPQVMSGFTSLEITLGRYLFFGGISLLFLLKQGLKGFPFSIWLNALFLSLLSGYYLWVILGIRYASAEICALILGISPITIAFYGNWKQKEGSFKRLIFPSILILIGLIMINAPHIILTNAPWEYTIGLICSVISLLSWSVYVVLNSRFLKNNPHIRAKDWATMQGVATLAWVIICSLVGLIFVGGELDIQRYLAWNDDTIRFYAGTATLGLLCSWLGASLWNKASLYLPVSFAGQLMIFETIFGILFVYALKGELPALLECTGILLLLGAVILGIRVLRPAHSLV